MTDTKTVIDPPGLIKAARSRVLGESFVDVSRESVASHSALHGVYRDGDRSGGA